LPESPRGGLSLPGDRQDRGHLSGFRFRFPHAIAGAAYARSRDVTMTAKPLHSADEELLLYTDGELARRDSNRIGDHLAACPECSARLSRIQSAMAGFVTAQRRSQKPAMDVSGPRALLRARLAEMAGGLRPASRKHFSYARGFAYACALALMAVTGVAVFRQHEASRLDTYSRLLPDPGYTPGATRQVALADLCSTEGDEVVRAVPGPVQQKVLQEYGIHDIPASEFEVDYLITPGLGGSDDVRNLWPEPHSNTVWNSYVKDQLEDRLHRMVCERRIGLDEAQREIAGNWIAAYKKYFHTEQPLASQSLPNVSVASYSASSRNALRLSIGGL
jgi:anti-sigma factor RsiW